MTAVRRTLPAALTLCALAALGTAQQASAAALGGSPLSPDLAKLAQPSFRSLSHHAQANLLDVAASGPGSLVREEDGRVLVNVGFEAGAIGRLPALEAAGAELVAASRRYQTVSVSVPPADLRSIAKVPGVASVTESLRPVLHAASCEGGSVISEGVNQLNVVAARETFGLRGAGVTVGVLSDSYDRATQEVFGEDPIATHAEEDVESNDLTGPAGTCSGQQTAVDVIDDASPEAFGPYTDEGRGMLQIVHDVAPHAALAFATAFRSEISFAQNIERLAKPPSEGGAGANVIVDDVSYFEEPFYQDGPIANAITNVAKAGVTYLTAAGNENIISENRDIASWEAPEFRDAASCPASVQEKNAGKGPHCMDFDPGAGEDSGFGFTVGPEADVTVNLQWAEPWSGVTADLNAYLLAGGQIVAGAERNNIGLGKPVELLNWENASASPQEVELVINRCTGLCNPFASPTAKPRLKFILMGGVTKSQYQVSNGGDVVGPTIYGHAAATSAITLGAVRYSNSTKPETFSSRGPATHLFGPVSGTTPAATIPTEVIQKPDVVATDCGATTFFGQFFLGAWRFCGTSAAAPHAAGVAALMMQGTEPTATSAEVADALAESAAKVGAFGPDAVGAGLIEAKGALEKVGASPTTSDGPSTPVPPLEPPVEYEIEEKEPEVPSNPPVPLPTDPPTNPPTTQPPTETKTPPATSIKTHPRKLVRTHKALARVVFRFASEPAGASFRCQFDGSPWRACAATVRRWFGLGQHVVRAQAISADTADPTAAVFRFRVARSLPAPQSGQRAQQR